MSNDQLNGLTFTSRRASQKVSLPTMSQNPPQNPSEQQTDGTSSKTSAFVDDGAHLDAFIAPDLDGEGGPEGDVIAVGDDGEPLDDGPPDQVDKEGFFLLFRTAFDAPAMFDKRFLPLSVQPGEMPQARAASDAVHSLLEIWYPAALRPGNETLAHLLMAAPFLAAKVMVVREIFRAERAKAVQQQREQQRPAAPQESAQQGVNVNAPPPQPKSGLGDDWTIEGDAA